MVSPAESPQSGQVPELFKSLYRELRLLAARQMELEREDHTLQPTALVHEAYLRLADLHSISWEGKAHFLGAAAATMRRILVDHARRHGAARRGGGAVKITLNESHREILPDGDALDLLALDEALTHLGAQSRRLADVIELRFFGGLSVEETAAILGIASRTVKNDTRIALSWLRRELSKREA